MSSIERRCDRLTVEHRSHRIAAFEFGRGLSLLRWHTSLAAILGSRKHEQTATLLLGDLRLLMTRLIPDERGGNLSRQIHVMEESWDGILASEWFGEHFIAVLKNFDEDNDLTPAKVQDNLLAPVPNFENELWLQFKEQFDSPLLLSAQLGRAIGELHHSAEKLPVLVKVNRKHGIPDTMTNGIARLEGKSRIDETRAKLEHVYYKRKSGCRASMKTKRKRTFRSSSGNTRHLHNFLFVPIKPIPSIPAAIDHYLRAIKILWEENSLSISFPNPSHSELSEYDEFANYVHRLITAFQHNVEKSGSESPQNVNNQNWPPDDGWHVRDDIVAYRGRRELFSGKSLDLLSCISNEPKITSDRLIDKLWDQRGENEADMKKLRVLISTTNKHLRVRFKLPLTAFPIKSSGRGLDRCWMLSSQDGDVQRAD
jgi:hypothetical protein